MTVSRLTKSELELRADFLADLGGSGSHLTMSEEKILAAIRNTYGGGVSHLTTDRARLLASIATVAGTSTSALLKREERLLADLDAGLGGSDSYLTKSFSQILEDCANADTNGGGGGYVAKAVHLDGLTWVETSSLVAPENSLLAFSFWWKSTPAMSQNKYFWVVDPDVDFRTTVRLGRLDGTAPGLIVLDEYPHSDLDKDFTVSSTIAPSYDEWHHVLGCSDVGFDAGAKLVKLYIDDIDRTQVTSDASGAFTIEFNGFPFYIPAPDQWAIIGDMADVWIAPGQSLGEYPVDTTTFRI